MMAMPDSALIYYNMYIGMNPANPSVVSKAAKIHLEREEYVKVLDMAEDYLQIDSTNMGIRGLKGLAYFLMEDFNSSEDVFQNGDFAEEGDADCLLHIHLAGPAGQDGLLFHANGSESVDCA